MSELSDSAVEIWTVIEQHEPDDMQKYDQLDIDDIESAEPDVDSEDYFLQYYADFLNRLVHHKFIPQSTVQEIDEEYFINSMKSQEMREKKRLNPYSGRGVQKSCKLLPELTKFLF